MALDMDGVIYNSETFIAQAYHLAMERGRLRYDLPKSEAIMAQVGKPVREIFRALFPGLTQAEEDTLREQTLISIGEMIREGRGVVFPGIPEALKAAASQARLHVCSNGRRQYLQSILDHYDLGRYFESLVTLEDGDLEHKGELLRHYIQGSGVTAEQWVMVGDRRSDLEAARFNGCAFAGCLWGHGQAHELVGASQVLKEPGEIPAILSYYK